MPLGDGNYHYHYNTVETQAPAMEDGGEPRTQYESDTVFVAGEPTVAKIVAAVVHESYTDDDIALLDSLDDGKWHLVYECDGDYFLCGDDNLVFDEECFEETSESIGDYLEQKCQ